MLKCTLFLLPCPNHENLCWYVTKRAAGPQKRQFTGTPLRRSSPRHIYWLADHWISYHCGYFSLHFPQLLLPLWLCAFLYTYPHPPGLPLNLSKFSWNLPEWALLLCSSIAPWTYVSHSIIISLLLSLVALVLPAAALFSVVTTLLLLLLFVNPHPRIFYPHWLFRNGGRKG